MHGSNNSGDVTALLMFPIFNFIRIPIRAPAAFIRTEAFTTPCSNTATQVVPFTEETVYNSDRHVAILLCASARKYLQLRVQIHKSCPSLKKPSTTVSGAHAMEDRRILFTNSFT